MKRRCGYLQENVVEIPSLPVEAQLPPRQESPPVQNQQYQMKMENKKPVYNETVPQVQQQLPLQAPQQLTTPQKKEAMVQEVKRQVESSKTPEIEQAKQKYMQEFSQTMPGIKNLPSFQSSSPPSIPLNTYSVQPVSDGISMIFTLILLNLGSLLLILPSL